jgi:hypothetical protein
MTGFIAISFWCLFVIGVFAIALGLSRPSRRSAIWGGAFLIAQTVPRLLHWSSGLVFGFQIVAFLLLLTSLWVQRKESARRSAKGG